MTQSTGPDFQLAVQELVEKDPVLATVIKQIGPCRLSKGESGFVSLVNAIVSQQLSGYAYRAIRNRLEALFDGGKINAAGLSKLSFFITGTMALQESFIYYYDSILLE